MKTLRYFWPVLAITIILAGCDSSVAPNTEDSGISSGENSDILGKKGPKAGTTIQSGLLVGSDGNTLHVGFDDWGYNYQAMLFNGKYCDAYRDAAWCQPYKDVNLSMKWNDAWLSNIDRDGDGELDRHYGFASYIGSGAWLTNHQSGEYEDDGKTCKWTYFIKIVAAPADAYPDSGNWYTADGVLIGPVTWGSFATIQTVSNDPCTGEHGLLYKGDAPSGFGRY
jgi:hypothetical protein